MRVLIVDRSNKIIHGNLSDELRKFIDEQENSTGLLFLNGIKARYARMTSDHGTVYLMAEERDLVKSNRLFKEKIDVYTHFIQEAEDIKDQIIDDLLHNLTRIHGHNIQEIHSVIPEEFMDRPFDRQLDLIKTEIVNNLSEMATTFIQIIRNNRIMKAEFDNIRLLYGATILPVRNPEPIHRIIQSIIYLYQQDCDQRTLRITNGPNQDLVELDYNLFVGALIPIFENISKYCKRESRVDISYEKVAGSFTIRFKMTSLAFNADEEEKIFEKGYSGELSRKLRKNGKGLGMYNAKQLLALNRATVRFSRSNNDELLSSDESYCPNVLEIDLDLRR